MDGCSGCAGLTASIKYSTRLACAYTSVWTAYCLGGVRWSVKEKNFLTRPYLLSCRPYMEERRYVGKVRIIVQVDLHLTVCAENGGKQSGRTC